MWLFQMKQEVVYEETILLSSESRDFGSSTQRVLKLLFSNQQIPWVLRFTHSLRIFWPTKVRQRMLAAFETKGCSTALLSQRATETFAPGMRKAGISSSRRAFGPRKCARGCWRPSKRTDALQCYRAKGQQKPVCQACKKLESPAPGALLARESAPGDAGGLRNEGTLCGGSTYT